MNRKRKRSKSPRRRRSPNSRQSRRHSPNSRRNRQRKRTKSPQRHRRSPNSRQSRRRKRTKSPQRRRGSLNSRQSRRRKKSLKSPQIKTIKILPMEAGKQKSPNGKSESKYGRVRLHEDGYKKQKGGKTKQEIVSENPELLKKNFVGFERILPDEYESIMEGTFIRYLKDRKLFRFGGYLDKNKYPDYWVLRNTNKEGRKVTWCVPLKGGKNIYCKRIKKDDDKPVAKSMKEVYQAISGGEYKLVRKDQLNKYRRNTRNTSEAPKEKIIVALSEEIESYSDSSDY